MSSTTIISVNLTKPMLSSAIRFTIGLYNKVHSVFDCFCPQIHKAPECYDIIPM